MIHKTLFSHRFSNGLTIEQISRFSCLFKDTQFKFKNLKFKDPEHQNFDLALFPKNPFTPPPIKKVNPKNSKLQRKTITHGLPSVDTTPLMSYFSSLNHSPAKVLAVITMDLAVLSAKDGK